MKKTNVVIVVLSIIIAGGAGFFAGIKYQQGKQPAFFRDFANRQQGQLRGQAGVRGSFRPVNGEIIAVDEKTFTVKLQDGSSRIVIISENTQINKAEQATKDDLKVGEKVMVFGQENSDGSLTAQNIQLNSQFRNLPRE